MKNYTEDELLALIDKAPKLIQDTIGDLPTVRALGEIGKSADLHIDQIGTLANLNVQMLLGLIGPQEFLRELLSMGIADQTARKMMGEINQKIFMPLQAKIRAATPVHTAPSLPSAPTMLIEKTPVAVAQPAATKTTEPDHMLANHEEPHMEVGSRQAAVVSQPLITQAPAPIQPLPVQKQQFNTFVPKGPSAPQAMHYGTTVETMSPQQTSPLPRPMPEPPANLPGAMPPIKPAAPLPPQPKAPIIDKYSVDPYREPPE